MVKCNKCGVTVNSSVRTCPLCQNELDTVNVNVKHKINYFNLKNEKIAFSEDDIFPYIEPSFKRGAWTKVLSAIVLITVAICTYIDFMISNSITWSTYVDLALLCVVLSVTIAIQKKRNLSGILFYEYLLIVFACVFWDFYTGYHGWALNYVLPTVSPLFVVVNFIFRLVFKREFLKYYRNVMVAGVASILAFVLLKLDINNSIWLSCISGIIGLISVVGLSIFDGKKAKQELIKRLHV